ncbi:MucR family transcriptional regulator [Nitrospirillum pindoramense]|uniref:MucR family transcriptional regulator n=1 Tax=Nitrospirillum amazonense TaxID=28077 RepID=A0A560HHA4_9PROT|nr:MucR family transcriptional regulator [Nitrospirillum amazonense]TWB45826.1 MucR family transcriptional regulator [Nitrospirillum amazonense]
MSDISNIQTTADIVAAYVSNNLIRAEELASLIQATYATVTGLGQAAPAAAAEPEKLTPAVPIRRSVTPEYIVCLEDGRKLKMLKRHLRTAYNLTPDEYRARWGLPADYPMVAPAYAEKRSGLAKSIGLGKATRGGGEGKPAKAGKKAA